MPVTLPFASAAFPVRPMSADQVGRIIVRAARRGARDRVISAPGRFLTILDWLSPALVDFLLARSWQKRHPRSAPDLPE